LAYAHARAADLMLVMGSSLLVSVWAVEEVAENRKAKLVIINLQKTPFDDSALVIHERTDKVMKMVMDKLNILTNGPWELQRNVEVSGKLNKKTIGDDEVSLTIKGVDPIGQTYSFIPALNVDFGDGSPPQKLKNSSNLPFLINKKVSKKMMNNAMMINVDLYFVGHYGEIPLTLKVPLKEVLKLEKLHYKLFWNPSNSQWRIECPDLQQQQQQQNVEDTADDIVNMKIEQSVEFVKENERESKKEKEKWIVENVYESLDDQKFKWTLTLNSTNPALMKKVKSVTFRLHETFHPDFVKVSEPPFSISRIGWGTFTIPIEIEMNNSEIRKFEHQLINKNSTCYLSG